MHDFNPGILRNGLFWTMALPDEAFRVRRQGRWARLRAFNVPMPDTFQFANNVSVAAEIDINVTWRATSEPVTRGKGTDAAPDNLAEAYLGEMSDARCSGTASARETGFSMTTSTLTEEGFFAQLGTERNGAFLT